MIRKFSLTLLLIVHFLLPVSILSQAPQISDPLISHIDSSVKPGSDFFMYANGKWFKENPIPPTEPSNGIWQLIQDTINVQVRSICQSSAKHKNYTEGSNKQKIGDFYFSGMDSISLNKDGLKEIKNDLKRIDGISDLKTLVKEVAYCQIVSGSPLFSFGIGQDDRISSKNAIFIWQGGLSLPDKRYYFDSDSAATKIRKKFVDHLSNVYQIIGYDKAKSNKSANNLMKLETSLAGLCRNREDTRDPLKNYNKISYQKLLNNSPNLEWDIFLKEAGLKNVDTVIIGQPEFLTSINNLIKTISLDQWKDYLKYHFIRGLQRYLDDKTYLEFFSFYSKTLRGVQEPKPRWKRVVEETNASLGELIGQVYVDEYLPKGTKEKLQEIGNAIKEVYAQRIKNLDWMSEATKEKALTKLNKIIMKIGYPDKWKDLSAMKIDRSSFIRNGMSANRWEFNYMTAKYGKSVDRNEWNMEPQTYNAYYSPTNNEIVIPGCNILVPGYEHKLADDAILYGIIGGTFGHEITHGFDDQGSKYDDKGNLNNWWTPEDSIRFFAKTKMIVDQYNNYIAVDSLHINGELTQGENIADLGGTIMAFEAFKKTDQFKNDEMIAGFSPAQRFFLGYALGWMVNERRETIANQVRSDEHSPVKFRVNGPLSNMPEFYKAFGVKEGDPMWRSEKDRIEIW
jgi:putative endopeptidase